VVILGGMGSISGALVGALALGLVQSVVGYALDDSWSRMVAYLLLYVIILLRPQGLFGRAAA
jgi:branched-chain amino acid transport system permease protein